MPKIKGTAILNTVRTLRSMKDDARRVLRSDLHHYLEDRVLVSEWYPEVEQLELLRALVKLIPDQGMDPWEFMGRYTAQSDLTGLYKNLLRGGDPVRTLKNGAVLWRTYHDTGNTEVVFDGPSSALVRLKGYRLPSREMCGILGGWYGEMVRMAGGREVQVKHEECVLDKADCCQWAVKWLEPADEE